MQGKTGIKLLNRPFLDLLTFLQRYDLLNLRISLLTLYLSLRIDFFLNLLRLDNFFTFFFELPTLIGLLFHKARLVIELKKFISISFSSWCDMVCIDFRRSKAKLVLSSLGERSVALFKESLVEVFFRYFNLKKSNNLQ